MKTAFISYSHVDETTKNELEKHLSALKRQGLLSVWHDRRINAGDEFAREISRNLESADVILLIISADFLNSDYCYDVEMKRAIERHEAREAVLIPIIARPCDWQHSPFSKIQAVPKDAKPIAKWADRDDAFLDIVIKLRIVLGESPSVNAIEIKSNLQSLTPVSASKPRSSNLRIKKEFTDREKSKFLTEGFEYVERFFHNSLEELAKRNSYIETAFRKIDANSFTAEIFRNGKAITACKIFLGGGYSSGINYASGVHSHGINETLGIAFDDQNLFFKPTMTFGSEKEKHLTFEGAAEVYWEKLMSRIQ